MFFKGRDHVGRRFLQPGEGKVRGKFLFFRGDADPGQCQLYLLLQLQERHAPLQTGPEDLRVLPRREMAKPLQGKFEWRGLDFLEGSKSRFKNLVFNLADKPQRQMELLPWHPAGAGQPSSDFRHLIPQSFRKVDGHEQADHRPFPAASAARTARIIQHLIAMKSPDGNKLLTCTGPSVKKYSFVQ